MRARRAAGKVKGSRKLGPGEKTNRWQHIASAGEE